MTSTVAFRVGCGVSGIVISFVELTCSGVVGMIMTDFEATGVSGITMVSHVERLLALAGVVLSNTDASRSIEPVILFSNTGEASLVESLLSAPFVL